MWPGGIRRTNVWQMALLVCGLIAAPVLWSSATPAPGSQAARMDLARGHYVMLTYGLPTPDYEEFSALLRKRYGVEVRAVAGCVVSESLRDYVRDYNEVSMAAANKRFGRDIFAEAQKDAQIRWRQLHPENAPTH
jgi:hypothetical protein